MRKLLSVPLYAIGGIATALIPRSRRLWVFGSSVGIADGAREVWEVASAHGEQALWLGAPRDGAEAARRDIRFVSKNSIRGFWFTARAAVIVITHGFGDVNRYAVGRAHIVQLWHGIPLKKIGLDSPETVRHSIFPHSRILTAILATMYRFASRRIRLIPAASHRVRGRLESAFALPDQRVAVTGEPRVDVLSRGTAAQRRDHAHRRLRSILGPRSGLLILYAPTWRDGDLDPAIPNAEQWQLIDQTLARIDATLLIRSHPLGAGEYQSPSRRIAMLGDDLVADVTELLPGIDILITDYSSLLYDVGLVPVPVLFLAPDVAEYRARRGFYGDYDDITGATHEASWEGVLAQLETAVSNKDVYHRLRDESHRRSAQVHAYRDGKNTARVYRAIVAGMGQRTERR